MKRLWMIAGAVVLAGVLLTGVAKHHSATPKNLLPGQLVKVERGSVRKTVKVDGTLRALTTVSVKSNAGGKVVLLAVDVGDWVKKGDLIAKIDPTDTRAAYTQALADMHSAQAQLTEAQTQSQAQPALTLSAIAQAQATYDGAVADLRLLQTATQPRDRADAQAALDKATAALAAAQENFSRLTESTQPTARIQAQSDLDQANAALEQSQANLRRLKQATLPQALAQARTSLDSAKSNLQMAQNNLARQQAMLAKGYVSLSTVDAAQNNVDTAQAAFTAAQEQVHTITDDQAAQLHAAEDQVEQAQAARAAAQRKWEAIDEDQAAERRASQAAVQEAQADLTSAQRHWSTLDQDQAAELASARAKLTQAQGALESARVNAVQDRVRAAEVYNQKGQTIKAQALVDQTRTALSYATITAPRDGVILKKDVEAGSIIASALNAMTSEGMPIVELGDLSTMYVDASVDETDLADIRLGQKVEMTVDALEGKTLAGQVTRVDPQATTSSSITTVKVEIEVLDHDRRLLPGLTATCRFLASEKDNVLTLPAAAIQEKDGKWYALLPATPSPRTVLVEVGLQGDDTVEIISGLNEGDQVMVQTPSASTSAGGPSGDMPPPPGGGADFLKKS
jgi:HlyD family secretion protein